MHCKSWFYKDEKMKVLILMSCKHTQKKMTAKTYAHK